MQLFRKCRLIADRNKSKIDNIVFEMRFDWHLIRSDKTGHADRHTLIRTET